MHNISIIIDLALDHSDYYTLADSVAPLGFCLTADFGDRRGLGRSAVRHGPAAECCAQRWRDAAGKGKKRRGISYEFGEQ